MPLTDIDGQRLGDSVADKLGNRNLIINGAMQVAQRGTSVAVAASSIVYTLDRFCARPNSNTATTVTQVTDAPTGFQYSARVTRNSGQTGTLTRFETPLETEDIIRLRGQKVTISFYAKAGSAYSPTDSILAVQLFEGNGTERAREITSYDNETILVNSNKTLTTSWQRFTHATTVDVASDTTQLALQFNASWSGTAPANDEYFITGVQLEVGNTATPFEHRSFADELLKCQRYYQKSYDYNIAPGAANHEENSQIGIATSTTRLSCFVNYRVEMRIEPTEVIYSTSGNSGKYSLINNLSDRGDASVAGNHASSTGFHQLDVTNAPSGDHANFHYTADAEL